MNEFTKDFIKILIEFAIITTLYVGGIWYMFANESHLTLYDVKVIDVEVHDDYYKIYLDDNTSYKIHYSGIYSKETDFTNSQVILKLSKSNHVLFWYVENDTWTLKKIIKYGGDE